MADHMRNLFFDPTAPPDAIPPLPIPDFEEIDAAEIAVCLPRFRGAASSGMCPLPSQVVKHLAGEALTPLARFLNLCIAGGTPPRSWRSIKMVPLFKHKGDRGDPDSYRGLAVGHPLAKLAMAIVNQRLQTLADDGQLRAPTQAGFRAGHTVEDLALVLQVCIQ